MGRKRVPDEEIIEMAKHYIETEGTVRRTGEALRRGKSTIWQCFDRYLKDIDSNLYNEVMSILQKNKLERATRGANALKLIREKELKIKNTDKLFELQEEVTRLCSEFIKKEDERKRELINTMSKIIHKIGDTYNEC